MRFHWCFSRECGLKLNSSSFSFSPGINKSSFGHAFTPRRLFTTCVNNGGIMFSSSAWSGLPIDGLAVGCSRVPFHVPFRFFSIWFLKRLLFPFVPTAIVLLGAARGLFCTGMVTSYLTNPCFPQQGHSCVFFYFLAYPWHIVQRRPPSVRPQVRWGRPG